jgi:hypothetical protein
VGSYHAAPGRLARLSTALRAIPAWAQVAAALLFLGVAGAIANLDVRYDGSGLSVRTGWSGPAAAAARDSATASREAGLAPMVSAPWREDLVALERRLRTEFRPVDVSSIGPPPAVARAPGAHSVSEADIDRRVRALVEESERRQKRELALRVAEVMRDVNAQRQADLVKIDRSLGLIQNNTGVMELRQRELLNYVVRVSHKQ